MENILDLIGNCDTCVEEHITKLSMVQCAVRTCVLQEHSSHCVMYVTETCHGISKFIGNRSTIRAYVLISQDFHQSINPCAQINLLCLDQTVVTGAKKCIMGKNL